MNRSDGWVKRGLLAGILVFAGPLLLAAESMAAATAEYQVKAAFIFNFTKFVDWPETVYASPAPPTRICILGKDPFDDAFDEVTNKKVKGRGFAVDRIAVFKEGALEACHLLFVSDSVADQTGEILAAVKSLPILTISDIDGFARKGGMIEFRVPQKKVRLVINHQSSKGAGLAISSKLLKIADSIVETTDE